MEIERNIRNGSSGLSQQDLARLWRIEFPHESDPAKVETALKERIKELNCLYGISQLAERHLDSLEALLKKLVDFLPLSWQYPEITCARILYKSQSFTTENFRVTDWRQSSQIYMFHEPVGEVAIFYLEERPASEEGPFMKEERALLDAIAEQIGTIATRLSAELEFQEANRQLKIEREALRESNTALRLVLSRIEQEKQEISADIRTNVERVIEPILNALAAQLSPAQRNYLDLLRNSLADIASPYMGRLARSCTALTPTETFVCSLIRSGMRTKEIALTRGVSEATVNRQREKIRKKLKLTNQDVNLATYLQSVQT